MDNPASFLTFLHSLLRYGVILTLLMAVIISWRGVLFQRPILVWERMVVIIAVALCHVQLVLGGILYGMRFNAFEKMSPAFERFWKYEHVGTMVIAIVLVTIGRVLSKRAKSEHRKHLFVGIFFLIALMLILWATPWPFTDIGHGKKWI